MMILLAHNAVPDDSSPDDQDVLVQTKAIEESLQRMGYEVQRMECTLNLDEVKKKLENIKPDLVFNLVESLGGSGRLISLFPSLLDMMGITYTGSGAEAIFLTSNKLLAKSLMKESGLPTPEWSGPFPRGANLFSEPAQKNLAHHRRWIMKSVWEHASIGIDACAIRKVSDQKIFYRELSERSSLLGGSGFAEAFIEGREFNLSVLDSPNGPEVLPPAEIIFDGYSTEREHIVDYKAKWDESSFEYHHTPRSFIFEKKDRRLLDKLIELSLSCWSLFGLKGYARVDFRVDSHNHPFILEINANPCIAPDAGFTAALLEANISYDTALRRIIESAHQLNID